MAKTCCLLPSSMSVLICLVIYVSVNIRVFEVILVEFYRSTFPVLPLTPSCFCGQIWLTHFIANYYNFHAVALITWILFTLYPLFKSIMKYLVSVIYMWSVRFLCRSVLSRWQTHSPIFVCATCKLYSCTTPRNSAVCLEGESIKLKSLRCVGLKRTHLSNDTNLWRSWTCLSKWFYILSQQILKLNVSSQNWSVLQYYTLCWKYMKPYHPRWILLIIWVVNRHRSRGVHLLLKAKNHVRSQHTLKTFYIQFWFKNEAIHVQIQCYKYKWQYIYVKWITFIYSHWHE